MNKKQTWNNYRQKKSLMEKPKGNSLTIPDQSMSIKQLLLRHTRGQEIPIHDPSYQYEENVEFSDTLDLPDLDKLDPFEKMELADQMKDIVKETKKSIKQRVERVNKLAKQQDEVHPEDKPKNEGKPE